MKCVQACTANMHVHALTQKCILMCTYNCTSAHKYAHMRVHACTQTHTHTSVQELALRSGCTHARTPSLAISAFKEGLRKLRQ